MFVDVKDDVREADYQSTQNDQKLPSKDIFPNLVIETLPKHKSMVGNVESSKWNALLNCKWYYDEGLYEHVELS